MRPVMRHSKRAHPLMYNREMADFANEFPDVEVFQLLGDRVELLDADDNVTPIKAVFDFEYEEEELGDRLSMKIPYIDVTDEVDALIEGHRVRYNGNLYSVHHRRPIDTGIVRVVLRSVKAVL